MPPPQKTTNGKLTPATPSRPPADETERAVLEAVQTALTHAAKLGASASATNVATGQGVSVTVRNGEVETIEHHRNKSLSVTVYFAKRRGSASTTDLTPAAIHQSVASACAIAKHTEPDACHGLPDRARLATDFPDLNLNHPWTPTIDQAIDLAHQCETAALKADPRIQNSEGATVDTYQEVDVFANSLGFCGLERATQHSLSCSVIAGKGEAMQRDYWYDSSRDPKELAAPKAIGEHAAHRALRRLGAKKSHSEQTPVIFEPTVATSLLAHFSRAINGGNLYRNASFLVDKVGAQIFPKTIRIHEQPHLPKSPGGASFDDEGVATQTRDIVTDGVLQGYSLNSYTARKLKIPTTGNAGGMHNLQIDPTTDADLPALIQQMGRGLIVSELIGFGVNTVTGDYSRGAFGFWVENGEIQYPVQEFTIAGNLLEMFQDIAAVGSDTERRGNFRAGSILLNKLTIAGQ